MSEGIYSTDLSSNQSTLINSSIKPVTFFEAPNGEIFSSAAGRSHATTFTTSDLGSTWTNLSAASANRIWKYASYGNTIYGSAITGMTTRALKSTDNGSTWTGIEIGSGIQVKFVLIQITVTYS